MGEGVERRGSSVESSALQRATRNSQRAVPLHRNTGLRPPSSAFCLMRATHAFRRAERLQVRGPEVLAPRPSPLAPRPSPLAPRPSTLVPRPRSPLAPLCGYPAFRRAERLQVRGPEVLDPRPSTLDPRPRSPLAPLCGYHAFRRAERLQVAARRPSTDQPRRSTLDPRRSSLDPRRSTLDPRPSTLHPLAFFARNSFAVLTFPCAKNNKVPLLRLPMSEPTVLE